MPVINAKDLEIGRASFSQCDKALINLRDGDAASHACTDASARTQLVPPDIPRNTLAMAVRFSLFLLERHAPGEGVEVRVAPWGAVKILDGPRSDPHNLTPPDVIELEPWTWLRLACGITTWEEEKEAGHITAVGERDDLSEFLPLIGGM
jgi:hypothetical protein